MELLGEQEVWMIMSEDGEWLAKGNTRDRTLVHKSLWKTDKMRLLTYKSKGMAESAWKTSWFYVNGPYKRIDEEYPKQGETPMKAVKVKITTMIIE